MRSKILTGNSRFLANALSRRPAVGLNLTGIVSIKVRETGLGGRLTISFSSVLNMITIVYGACQEKKEGP
jgi:hypothetical protein